MPFIWILAVCAISCTTTIPINCQAYEVELDINRLGKLGIENLFFPKSCLKTFGMVSNFFFCTYVPEVNNIHLQWRI